MINRFTGEYEFLSNFYPCPVILDEIEYPSVEHAFQAAKTNDIEERKAFLSLTAGQAKRYGRKVTLVSNWEEIKDSVMYKLNLQKYSNAELKEKLLATGNEELVEGTTWNDRYWGIDLNTGIGLNKLGNILMRIRSEIAGD